MHEPSFERGIEVILSTIGLDISRSPLRVLGSIEGRTRAASAPFDVKGHTVIDLVSPKLSS